MTHQTTEIQGGRGTTNQVAKLDVPPTRSLPVSKMDSPYSARFRLARSGEKSRQHPLTDRLQMGGAPRLAKDPR